VKDESERGARAVRVAVEALVPGEAVLDVAATHYLLRVHRLRRGDTFVAFDPKARLEADASLVDERARGARFSSGELRPASVSPLAVTLLQAAGKSDKPDRVVRDATALGAARVVIVETERAVVRSGERAPERLKRWQKIALESMRQCGRGDMPLIEGPLSLLAALKSASTGLKVTLDAAAGRPFGDVVSHWRAPEPLCLLIGPEGGLSEQERALAVAEGFVEARLGPFTLRTETAAVAALGAIWGR